MKAVVLFLLLALAQERLVEVKVPRSEAAPYRKVLNDFKAAARQIADDPQGCLDTCHRLIEDIGGRPDVYAKLRDSVECNLRIEAPTGGYGDPSPFTPYLYRGRARLALLKPAKSSDVTVALKEMDRIFADFKYSIDHGGDAAEDLAKANERMKEIKALVGSPNQPLETPAVKGKAELDALRDKFQTDPKSAVDYYDENQKAFAGSPFEQDALAIRRAALLQVKVGQKDYEGIVKYCDENAAAVKNTPYARMFERERASALEGLANRKESMAREIMDGIRTLAAAGENAKVIERYDQVAAQMKETPYAGELERLVKDARSAMAAGAVSLVLKKLEPAEALLTDPAADLAVLNECARVAPEVKDTPQALSRLNQIRDQAKGRVQHRWGHLCDDHRFASAAKVLEQCSKHLSEAELKNWNEEIRKRCATYLILAQKSVQSGLADALRLPSPVDTLAGFSADDLRRILAVPDEKELVYDPDPALAWTGNLRRVLEAILAAGDPAKPAHADFVKMLEELNVAVAASVPLAPPGELNPYYKGAEALSFDLARRRLTAVVDRAKPAGRDQRKQLREQGEAVVKAQAGLISKIDLQLQKLPDKGKSFHQKYGTDAHVASIDEVWKKFPIDVERIGKIWEELFGQPTKGAFGATPLTDLEVREKELWTLYDSSWNSLAVESRKELARCLMVTTVMHHLLAGRPAQDVATGDDVRREKRLLTEVGGLTDQDLKGISPKVRRVIEAAKP